MNVKVVPILPSLNPDQNLKEVVEGLIIHGFEKIIIVNDGSNQSYDNYFNEISNFPQCYVIKHDVNKGKGRALKTAFEYYLENFIDYDGVVTADADGQHLPADIKKCANELKKDNIVFGVRDFDKENVPIKSRFGNKTTTNIIKILFGEKISDTQTGLRAISNEYITEMINQKGERFEYEINMLIYALNFNIKILQVPIETVYYENNRATHFHAFKDSAKIYSVIFSAFLMYTISSFICFLVDQTAFRLLTIALFNIGDFSILLSTIISRVFSATLNFNINKNIVFKSKEKNIALKYATLCVVQMLASAGFTTILFNIFKIDVSIVKIIVDLALMFISFLIQKRFIFKGEAK